VDRVNGFRDFVYTPGDDISPEQTELATSLRVPFITTPYPRWFYVTAVVVSDDKYLWRGLVPTEDEVRMVASFNEAYREYWYRDSFKEHMARNAPYDIDGGAVGRYLIKHENGGWGYRKHTWEYGPQFVPEWNAAPEPLEAVLDRAHRFVDDVDPKWVEWKSAHPEVFAAVSP
jgi:hypothetical protein